MAAKNFSLSYIYSHKDGSAGNLNRCAAIKRTSGTYYNHQCDNPAKIEFTQDDFNTLHPNNTNNITAQAVRYVDTPKLYKLESSVGRKFCGQHSPLAIIAKQVKALEAEKAEVDAWQAKRSRVGGRREAVNSRLSALNITGVREHRDRRNNELSEETVEVNIAVIEKLLARIDELS